MSQLLRCGLILLVFGTSTSATTRSLRAAPTSATSVRRPSRFTGRLAGLLTAPMTALRRRQLGALRGRLEAAAGVQHRRLQGRIRSLEAKVGWSLLRGEADRLDRHLRRLSPSEQEARQAGERRRLLLEAALLRHSMRVTLGLGELVWAGSPVTAAALFAPVLDGLDADLASALVVGQALGGFFGSYLGGAYLEQRMDQTLRQRNELPGASEANLPPLSREARAALDQFVSEQSSQRDTSSETRSRRLTARASNRP